MQYVGCSVKPLEKRWKTVLMGGPSRRRPIVKAVREFGWDNFDRSVVEECSEEERFDKASEWIERLDTIYPNGYNIRKDDLSNRGKALKGIQK